MASHFSSIESNDASQSMKPQMTATARSQGAANARVCGAIVLGACLALSWIISLVTGRAFVESGGIAIAIFWVGCSVASVVVWLHGLRRRGRLLLDCGAHPTRRSFLIMAALFFVGSVMGFLFFFDHRFGQWGTLFALLFAAYWLFMAAGSLRIYEQGVWVYWGLMRWKRVERYTWADDGTLIVKTSGPLSFLSRAAIPVPAERIDEFERLLSERVSIVSTT